MPLLPTVPEEEAGLDDEEGRHSLPLTSAPALLEDAAHTSPMLLVLIALAIVGIAIGVGLGVHYGVSGHDGK